MSIRGKEPGREADISSPPSAEVKNDGPVTLLPLYAAMTCTGVASLIFTVLFLLSFNFLSHNHFNSAKTTYAERRFFSTL